MDLKINSFKILSISLILVSSSAQASEYNLFNPVPDNKLRSMTTERPSKTDSPFTVDSGRLQLETSLLNYTKEKNNNAKTEGFTYGASNNFRLGLTQSNDIQLIIDAYKQARVTDELTNSLDKKDGYGDTTLRLKHNFFGNDGGDYALAAIGFIKFPTNQNELANDGHEGGVSLPFNINFSDGYSLGGMTQISALQDGDGKGHNAAFTNTLVLGKSITDRLSAYSEIYIFRNTEENTEWQNTLDFGTVYAVTDSFRIDTGVNFGISDYADDINFFVGTAYRF
jgi:hypothetical protein